MRLTTPFTALKNATSDIWRECMILIINCQKIQDKIIGRKSVQITQQVLIAKFTKRNKNLRH